MTKTNVVIECKDWDKLDPIMRELVEMFKPMHVFTSRHIDSGELVSPWQIHVENTTIDKVKEFLGARSISLSRVAFWSHATDISETLVKYYSYNKDGDDRIAIHYCDMDYCKERPYHILSNGGVSMLSMNEEEFGKVAAICARHKIIIDTIHEH